ncbi:MAG: alpha/beta hydrolase [Candidatus Saccharibacteria bacterium]|nr:alpha/beta hydrolase [Candidatus Saccharibacteria bacterium]
MTKQTLTLPTGEQIVYWEFNPEKTPTLVLVHGITGSHEGFQYVIPLLNDFHIIAPDLPGFGESPLPHEKLSLRDMGELLIDFVEELELDKPHVLGHSMGSLVVAEAVRQHPSSFAHKLILASPVPTPVGSVEMRRVGVLFSRLYYVAGHRLPRIGDKIAHSRKLSWVATEMIMTTKDKVLKNVIHYHHFKNLDFISSIGWNRRLQKEVTKTGMSRYKSALKQFDVLIINGNRDNVTPLKMQRKIARDIGATLTIVPGTGHLSHYEKPEQVANAIRDFLR